MNDFLKTMKNLGNKLLKARTDMGISERDAADATRLREDVIKNMESGSFDYKLPPIYKRGFLRIYAAFLKLDVDAIMEEYTMASATEEMKRKGWRAPVSEQQPEVAANTKTFDAPQEPNGSRFGDDEETEDAGKFDTTTKKMAVAIGGVILAVVLIVMIVSSLVGKKAPEENADIAIGANVQTQPVSQPGGLNEVEASELVLVLTAVVDTYVSVYPDLKTADGKPAEVFYAGPLQAGDTREFRSKVPIMVRLTDAERVKIERNGKPVDTKGAKGLKLFRIVSR